MTIALLAADADTDQNFVSLDIGTIPWVALGVIVVVLLAVDLYRHREAHEPTTSEAARESLFWVFCGLSFAVAVLLIWGSDAFGEYISGYLIEKSLSVDNVFVWSVLFTTMRIPVKYQHRVLFWGIFGALAFRVIFILVGSQLLETFSWLLFVFGAFLIVSGARIIQHRDDEDEEGNTPGLGLLSKVMPVSDELEGGRFFTRINAKRAATPLFAALVVIEITDVIFAIDSVPAILAISKEPYLIIASNAFAILGLRAMYFLLAGAKDKFHYLSHALGAVLIFVGIKMIASNWYHLNTWISLGIIVLLMIFAIFFSLKKSREEALA